MRIGLFGGTFNPVHLGHVAAARAAMSALCLDHVLFIPSGHPPLKGAVGLIDGVHRAAMTSLAVADDPRMAVCDDEIFRDGPSYTVDTLSSLVSAASAGTRFHFLLGSDCLDRLLNWKGIDEIRAMARFAIIARNGAEVSDLDPEMDVVLMPPVAVSSTMVRDVLADGGNVSSLVGPVVADYIQRHGLYAALQKADCDD